MSQPDYYALRRKIEIGRLVNETRTQYRKAARTHVEFTHWLTCLAWQCGVAMKTLRNWACWAREPDPVAAYERHLYVDREGARWRREMWARRRS